MNSYFNFTYHSFAWPMVFMGLFLFFLGWIIFKRPASYSLSGTGLIWAISFWVITYGAELAAISLDAKLFWDKIQAIGTSLIPVLWFIFICQYTNHKSWISRLNLIIISIIPSIILLSIFTNNYHGLFWDEMRLEKVNGMWNLVQNYGLIGKFSYIYFVSFSLTGIALLLHYLRKISGLKKKQTILVLSGMGIPVIAAILDGVHFSDKFGVGFLPIGFFGTAIIIAIAFQYYGMGKIIPVSYDKIVEEMEEGVIIINSTGQIVTMNPFARRVFKIIFYEENPPIDRLFPEWDEWRLEITKERSLIKKMAFDQKILEVTISKLAYTDEEISTVIMVNDITEQKAYEEVLKKARITADSANRAKSEFLANMSHELRTPLNHIIGFTDLVAQEKMGPLNDLQIEYLGDALSSSRHLLSLISDILDLSKIESRKMNLHLEEIDLKELIIESIFYLNNQIGDKDIIVKTDLNFLELFSLDRRKMKQIFFNLLSNSVKFTHQKGTITVKGEVKNHFIEISVIDSGIGINSKDLKRIFSPFEQIDNSMTRKYQGTGLGLNLTRDLVELHGGSIEVSSPGENLGTTFIVKFPV